MKTSVSKRRWARSAMGGLIAIVALIGCAGTSARAADDDEAPDNKFFRGILEGLGLRKDDAGINYRERSPLVVPPSRNLPAPEKSSATDKTPAWPTDPDVKRAREAKAERAKPRRSIEEESRPETPAQLDKPGAARKPGQAPTGEAPKDPTRPSTNAELGAKSIFSWGGLFGQKEEYATFGGEPPRTSLTEPPTGYRTPSPAQPYGIGKEKWGDGRALNPMDTPTMRGDR